MAEITSIEQQTKDKNRCSIFIDGKFYCGMNLEVAIKHRLKVGMQIDEALLDGIQLDEERAHAVERALNYLAASMKTKGQLLDYLQKKGYTRAVCDYALERLCSYGYIDDLAYCMAYANSVKSKGKRAIECDLIKRKADREAIDTALGEIEESDGQAYEVLKKYLRGKNIDKITLLKGYRYLLSRGFGYDVARSAVEKTNDE